MAIVAGDVGDVGAAQGDGGVFGNRDVGVAAACSGEGVAVLEGVVPFDELVVAGGFDDVRGQGDGLLC